MRTAHSHPTTGSITSTTSRPLSNMKKNPATDPPWLAMQLRVLSRKILQKCYPGIIEAWHLQVSTPATYLVNKRGYHDAARRVIADFLYKADLITTTPVALHMLYNHVPNLKPCFVVIDKAARMTKNVAILPIARHPDVPALWIDRSCETRRSFGCG